MRAQHDRALLCVRLRRAEKLSQGSDDRGFGVQVQGREWIVQDQKPWSPRAGGRHRPCQRHALFTRRGWLPERKRNAHKGQFGTLGIVGGARGMVGAPLLAARAALLCGAGKVRVGLLSDALAVDIGQLELMIGATDDALAADVLVVGPGAGRSGDWDALSTLDVLVGPLP